MRNLVRCIAALGMLVALPAAAETYHLDPGHTEIRFTWNHAGLTEQSGRWNTVGGTVDFDREKPLETKINVTIDPASINTGVAALDKHLQTADFFEVEAHPEITFASTGAVQTGIEGLQITGDLTVKGQTKPVVLDVALTYEGAHPVGQFLPYYEGEWIGIKATGTILRSEFGLGFGAPLTSDHVVIEINSEMRKGGWPE